MPFRVSVVWIALVAGAFAQPVEHVIVIGCDGMSPDGIANAATPVMDRMMSEGAYTMHARAVMPTSSSPNWASMIMGAGPEQHGITSNGWKPDDFETAPVVTHSGGIYPTIFGIIREQRPGAVTACVYDWSGFGRLFEHSDVTVVQDSKGPENTTSFAVDTIVERKPVFTFVHLDHVDHVGHDVGHGTKDYYDSVEEADAYIGRILDAVNRAGIGDTTAIIVTSDHGGKGKGHGGNSMAEIEIPWIITGPGAKTGHRIESPVNTYDTAATVARLLGIVPHPAWIGRPVEEALEH